MTARKLKLLDETIRNAQQSLWATRMRTESMLPIADVMDRAGFDAVCVAAGVTFETAAMYLHEDPWERMRLLRHRMPGTRFDVLVRARNLWGWTAQPHDVQRLFLETLMRNGVDSFKLFDGLNDLGNMAFLIAEGRRLGFRIKGLVGFNESPVHTDEYLAAKAAEFVAHGVDAVILSDSPGVMMPERARSAITRMRAAIGEVELDFHCHTTAGLGRAACREAIRAGVDVIWTAARPLAWGASLPAAGDILRMALEEGRSVDVDPDCLDTIDDWFTWVAHREGRPIPEEKPFDPGFYQRYVGHQIPGGMISNLAQQLKDRGLEDRLPEVLEEAERVRRELGYPHMATPFSQFVGVQALMNVLEGERYANPPEALRLYARGAFGRPIAPLDPDVQDRLAGDAPPIDPQEGMDEPVLPRIRAEHGPFESDEDLLTFLFLHPAAYRDYRRNRRPIPVRGRPHPVVCLAGELMARRDFARVEVASGQDVLLRIDGPGAPA
ncbi:MAG: pyruvate carboxylase subunit B [Alphaproteobacteria bacterium]|nr:MAG: pyruvate carboxylase subunit B [Alphaproteobacteria bacterium]